MRRSRRGSSSPGRLTPPSRSVQAAPRGEGPAQSRRGTLVPSASVGRHCHSSFPGVMMVRRREGSTMRLTKRLVQAAGLAAGVVGVVAVTAPESPLGRRARRLAERLARDMRYATASAPGILYRLAGRRPDPDVGDDVLADRIRSTIGPLEKRLDVHARARDGRRARRPRSRRGAERAGSPRHRARDHAGQRRRRRRVAPARRAGGRRSRARRRAPLRRRLHPMRCAR